MMEEEEDLEAQLASKEKEWRDLQARCIQQLEKALGDTRAELSAQKERFQQLQEDFQFNLRVLDERDRELERYDAMAARLQTTESARQAETSELRIQINKLQEALAKETRKREEIQRQYQQRLAEHRLQLERVQSVKDCDIQKHREEYETLKRELERKIQEVAGELALQKQELMADFDSEMKRREHEFNLRADEMSNTVLSHELKVKLLSKELAVHTQAHSQAAEALQACEEQCRVAHKDIQRKDWEVKDIAAVKNARIKELEDKLSTMELNREKEEEIYNRKHEELDRCAREREAAIGALREAHGEELRQAESRARELQAALDAALMERRRAEWSHADALREKEEHLEKLRTELETTRAGWDVYITQVSKDTVSKDVELQTLGEREARLRAELQRCQEDVERYKRQVAGGVQRERALEQARVQVELDWQRRLEDAQAGHYLKSEELIQGLTQARDQAMAELRERERELQDATAVLRSVTLERDQALQRAPGPPARDAQGPHAEGSGTFPSEEIQRLQQQNSSLRAAIANMRRDMESLSEQLATAPPAAPPTAPPTAPPAQKRSPAGAAAAAGVPEYCQALQEEVAELKARCRLLQNQLEEASKAPVPAPGPAPAPALPVTADNAYLQNHTRSLNETIGGLRAEKVSNAANLRKQEVRLAHLESTLAQLTQQIHSKQVECDELRFELANQKKRAAGEEAGLRQRLAAVEMELDEVRREAEEYQRGSLLQNLEAVALGNQVSALKLDIASGREPIVVEQSAALRQLQEENLRLRQQLLGQDCGERRASAPLLRSKLKQAVRCIAQLTQDRQRLIEVGNRLRSRLTEAGLDDVQQPGPVQRPVSAPESSDSAKDPTQLQPRLLSALEQLQYRLTTQALQYAQLDHHKKAARSRFSGKGTSESDSSINPWDQHGHTRQPHTRGKKENTPPEASQSQAGEQMDPGQASGMGRPSSPSQALMSSVGTDESLGDIWRMLERGSDLSAFTARSSPDRGGEREHARGTNQGSSNQAPGSQVRVQGTKMAVQERRKPMTSRAESAKNPRAHGKTGKIRNYNIKD
ncbi:coiled-coil domain-containing protein 57 isoform X4 [Anguilla anguilla]|uniref:coiled-coil domain-containing protein 57 isoform X4 n=1 Tax=Anguilla anguilla TaxID=7936 RepID=UPI0015ADE120|nr:coiled-coil domain-containing protein 57 isoform X4 [Anguilla anguilla]